MALSKKEIKIGTLLIIDTAFFLLEIIIGYMVNSLALIADSFHMLNDIISLVVALWAVNVAKNRSADADYTYGWLRAEILGALINAVFLIALCFTIFIEAVQRLISPPVITNAQLILIVGICGLISNIVGLFLFHDHGHSHGGGAVEAGGHSHSHFDLESNVPEDENDHEHAHSHETSPLVPPPATTGSKTKHRKSLSSELAPLLDSNPAESDADFRQVLPSYVVGQLNGNTTIDEAAVNKKSSKGKHDANQKSLNMQGVFLHVLGDALGNVGVIMTALLIWKTDYSWKYYFDPIISLFITCIIFSSAVPLCKSSSRILLQGTPLTIETSDVVDDVLEIPSVLGVHDFHIWNLTEQLLIASLHVELDCSPESFLDVASEIKSCLHEYGIHSATIQPEFSAFYSKQHRLPSTFSSSQNLGQEYLNKKDSATFDISNSHPPPPHNHTHTHDHQHNDIDTAPTTAHDSYGSTSGTDHDEHAHGPDHDHGPNHDHKHHHKSQPEIHCLVDAIAKCTTADCLK